MDDRQLFSLVDPEMTKLAKAVYDASPDKSHNWSHIQDVAHACHLFAEKFALNLKPLLIAALWHDVFSHSHRRHHHLLAGDTVRRLTFFLDPDVREQASLCCEQHRASYTGEYSGKLQEAFASADRGVLKFDSIKKVVQRSYDFTRSKGYSHEEAVTRVVEHMEDKYSHTGYAKWPLMYQEMFSAELQVLKDEATNMTEQKVLEILEGR